MDLQALLNRVGNPLTIWLLRSPLHGLLSRSIMLVTVTGRRSGTRFTVPVNYRRDGDRLDVVSWRRRRWWRNLGLGAPVIVRLAGQDRPAWGEVVDDAPQIAAWLKNVVATTPAAGHQFGIAPEAVHQPTTDRFIQAARDRVLVRFHLAD